MNEKTKESIKTITVASVSAIPLVGGSLSVLLDKYLPNYIQRKKDQFLEEVGVEIERLKAKNLAVDIESEEFMTTLIKCTKLVLDESKAEKIEAYKNIILNSSLAKHSNFDEKTLFLSWLEKFTIDQIRIIKAVLDGQEGVVYVGEKSMWKFVSKIFPELPSDYMMVITQELVSNAIFFSGSDGDYRKAEMPKQEKQLYFITPIGERFIKFISTPVD